MEEQFVTYELALKLKELGFDEECFGRYEQPNWKDIRLEITKTSSQNVFSWQLASAPLWQQCIDWFREKYEISIEILYEGGLHSDTFEYSYQIFSNYSIPKSEKMKYYKCREQAILKAIELCKK